MLGSSASAALRLQFSMRRYIAWTYWLAVSGWGCSGRWPPTSSTSALASPTSHRPLSTPPCSWRCSSAWYGRDRRSRSTASTPTSRVLLLGRGRDVRDGHGPGRPHGDLHPPRLLRLAVLFAALISVPAIGYWRFTGIRSGLLVRLRGHPAARRLVRRLAGEAQACGARPRRRPRRADVVGSIFCLVAYLAITRRDVQRTVVARGEGVRTRRGISDPVAEPVD